MNKILLIVNDNELIVTLEDNITVKELLKRLENNPLIIKAKDYGNFEKVGSLGFKLPTVDNNIHTNYGDIVLYNGSNISLFYNHNYWSYTKIGHIDNITQEKLIDILGQSDVILKLL